MSIVSKMTVKIGVGNPSYEEELERKEGGKESKRVGKRGAVLRLKDVIIYHK